MIRCEKCRAKPKPNQDFGRTMRVGGRWIIGEYCDDCLHVMVRDSKLVIHKKAGTLSQKETLCQHSAPDYPAEADGHSRTRRHKQVTCPQCKIRMPYPL